MHGYMKILVTGAKGFVGKNLCSQLNNIKTGKAKCYGDLVVDDVFEYDLDSTPDMLDQWCKEADFVFNLAGVNRPRDPKEFMEGNFGFATVLLNTLKKYNNNCPVMISSSIQATLAGRFGASEYGKSKKAGEELMFQYGEETGARVLVYRFPNLYGKWCRPNYNSAVATFCNNIANDLPIIVNDPTVDMELLYIDDLVEEMICALKGEEHHCEFDGVNTVLTSDGRYCASPVTHKTTLGYIVDVLNECACSIKPKVGQVPSIINYPVGSFEYTLMTTFLSYLPKEKVIIDLNMNDDQRGSFTELFHILSGGDKQGRGGQVSVNISRPGITKGEHWHHTKWELFIVVSGHGKIQLRNEADPNNKILEYEVSGDKIQCVIMLPGYTHNIINLSDCKDLVTVMYCNEIFNSEKPDTFFDPVKTY